MQLSDFDFVLPERLIAHYPAERRRESRLLCLDAETSQITHRGFADLLSLVDERDLLVFNDTRVIPARLYAHKASGGAVEIMVERMMEGNRVLAQLRASKPSKPGTQLTIDGVEHAPIEVVGRQGDFYVLQFADGDSPEALFVDHGHMPLPPYIKRDDEAFDAERYQTVYARENGAVAAPTAGLHFDEQMLADLAEKGVQTAYLTLHVGAGTFQPVRVDNIEDHRMHTELIDVGQEVCDKVAACRARGGRVIAVGTTTVRSLETAAAGGELLPMRGETDIFIYPGYQFRAVDALITNFHLPQSTLLMLVSAFCSRDTLMATYQEAIDNEYRFYSYGDAMLLGKGV
jgi:S-adenosylmethionine:tRNA ribosyltransferase-isomerase